mmetsp:Transcript_33817/g.84270  ORF Transcript_33817/g.84270 Transcript_33817/m.84270 type:complete len:360 (+) Transcript_33817:3-1082(+)
MGALWGRAPIGSRSSSQMALSRQASHSSSHMALSRQAMPLVSYIAPTRTGLPPVGATFTDTMLLPVIGLQTIRLSITSRSLARIQLSGALMLNEVVSYGVSGDGKLEWRCSDHTLRVMHALGVSLKRAEYCPEADSARVTVKIPAFPSLIINLRRLHPPRHWPTAASPRAASTLAAGRDLGREQRRVLLSALIQETLHLPGRAVRRAMFGWQPEPATLAAQPIPARTLAAAATAGAAVAALASPLAAGRAGLPPVGSAYAHTLTIPVLGRQSFRLSIETLTGANIEMAGAIKLAEPIVYGTNVRGELDFTLSKATMLMLRGFGVALTRAEYCPKTDMAFVTIKPPAFSALRIGLNRLAD